MVLMSGKTVVGELNPSVTKGMNRTDQIEMLDSCTFKITCQYTALEDMETARINLDTAAHPFPEQPTRKEHGLPLPCGATSPRMKKRVSPVP